MSQKNIQDELRGLGISLPEANTPYMVPDGYFDGLASAILTRIQSASLSVKDELESISPLLSGISKQMPYAVPENYFSDVVKDVPVLIHDDEVSSLLKYIDRENPYQVPAGYFDHLSDQILEKVTRRATGAKVIPMIRRKWSRFAVAASILVVAASGIFYFNRPAKASKDPIAQIKKASNQDLFDFLNSTDANLSNSATASFPATEDAKKLLQDVPDNELNSFLNMEGADDVSSSVN